MLKKFLLNIIVIFLEPIDFEEIENGVLELFVKTVDKDFLQDIVPVKVFVNDMNDCAPIFLKLDIIRVEEVSSIVFFCKISFKFSYYMSMVITNIKNLLIL